MLLALKFVRLVESNHIVIKSKLKRGTSVIGFLSHLQGDLKAKAMEAGCDMVMPRSAFSQNLPNLLRRHGLDSELEAVEA